MCHDIVSPFLFFFSRDLELLPIQMLHKTLKSEVRNSLKERGGEGTDEIVFLLFDGFIRDRKSKLLLPDGEIQPYFSSWWLFVLWKIVARTRSSPPSTIMN